MDVKMAYGLIARRYKDFKIIRCFEYDTRFVFQIVPKDLDETMYDKHLNGLKSVDKKSGSIQTFIPFDMPLEEYNNGREIKKFK